MTEAGDQMSEAQDQTEPNSGLSKHTGYSDQNSRHIDAEKATVEKSNERSAARNNKRFDPGLGITNFEQAKPQQTTLPQDRHHLQT